MTYYYAQIDPNTGSCFSVSSLSGPVESKYMIPLEEENTSLCGARWTGDSWEFPPEPGFFWNGTEWVSLSN